MELLAHALWAGAGSEVARRRGHLPKRAIPVLVTLAVLPDLVQYLPLLVALFLDQIKLSTLIAFMTAAPGAPHGLPPLVWQFSHHLHCTMHSIVIACAVTLVCWARWRAGAVVLAGWWSHILIDMFSHSADYYAVPVLYPFSMRGLDGFAWNTPAFFAVNYTLLIAVYGWLWHSQRRGG